MQYLCQRFVVVFALLSASCATVNPVSVCGGGQCATGYYAGEGVVSTAAHPFAEGGNLEVTAQIGYSARGGVSILKNDEAAVNLRDGFSGNVCYGTAQAGDFVTVSALYGPVRTRVLSVHPNGFVVAATLRPGDSGAAVTRRRCVIGQVHGLYGSGGTVILRRE